MWGEFSEQAVQPVQSSLEGTSPAKAVKLPIVGMAMLVASNSDKHRWNLRFFTKYTSFWCPFSCGRKTECALPLLCLKLICLIARFSTYETHLFVDSASVVSIFARNTFFVNEPFFPNTLEFFTRKNCAGEKNRAKPGFAQHFP